MTSQNKKNPICIIDVEEGLRQFNND